jgi:hypothetical protein
MASINETLLGADWFEYDAITGLRLDGYFTIEELESFVWALRHYPEALTNAMEKKRNG